MLTVRAALAKNRADAAKMVGKVGARRLRADLLKAEAELVERLAAMPAQLAGSFTEAQMQATLVQIREVLRGLKPRLGSSVVETAREAASEAGGAVADYLEAADAKYRGVGSAPLALDEARMISEAAQGAQASVLRRLLTSGEEVPGAEKAPHLAKMGILDRYGENVVGHFEDVMRRGLITRKPWAEVRSDLVSVSPFLQGAPAHWAERILRTETMGAYNRGSWEAAREANAQLGDLVKILSATFDNRTAADSYAVHGQIRRTEEAFETWYGAMQHPPSRPNDREVVVTHRIAWPLPAALKPKTRAEVVARWRSEKRKGEPPPTPLDTTVPRESFGVR